MSHEGKVIISPQNELFSFLFLLHKTTTMGPYMDFMSESEIITVGC